MALADLPRAPSAESEPAAITRSSSSRTGDFRPPRRADRVAMSWRVISDAKGVKLNVRPLISGRDYHSLHRENLAFNFDAAELPRHRRADW
jgi:hypothetical protein